MNSPLFSASDLAGALKTQTPPVVVDCRYSLADSEAGFRAYESGHIPTAVYAHLDNDLAGPITPSSGRHPLPDLATFVRFLGSLGIAIDRSVVVYDDAKGAFAARLWWMLRALGHQSVSVLEGGLQSYVSAGGALETDVHNNPETEFVPQLKEWAFVTTNQLGKPLDFSLIDARNAERYVGKNEPIDRVAGHIPGAVNLPFEHNMDADGYFLAPQAIRENFRAILNPEPHKPVAVMCGSGVTACHLLLAQKVASLKLAELYVGSWSEWIRDPTRPIATDNSS